MADINQQAKTIAAQIRSDLRAAVKNGRLPNGTKVSVRKGGGSLCVDVNAHVDTPAHVDTFELDEDGHRVRNQLGRRYADLIRKIIAPHAWWHDGQMTFIFGHLDGPVVGGGHAAVKPTVRLNPTTRKWVVDPQGRHRLTGTDVETFGSHEEALRSPGPA